MLMKIVTIVMLHLLRHVAKIFVLCKDLIVERVNATHVIVSSVQWRQEDTSSTTQSTTGLPPVVNRLSVSLYPKAPR